MPKKSVRSKKVTTLARIKGTRFWDIRLLIVLIFMAVGAGFIAATSAESYALKAEFDGAKGSSPSSGTWYREVGNGQNGWGNKELQYYTGGAANSYLDGAGHLVLEAKKSTNTAYKCWNGKTCKYTSAKLLTKGKFSKKYGHFEARIQMSNLQSGLWPAFWMLGNDKGEIDIMENFGRNEITGAMHSPKPGDCCASVYGTPTFKLNDPRGWHTYSVNWTESKVSFYVDGRANGSISKSSVKKDRWVFDRPFYIILNMAVGGNALAQAEPKSMPAKMLVDYVRVW